MEITESGSSNPVDHARKIQELIGALKEHCRSESGLFTDTRARALLETTADVLDGLEKAFHDFLSNDSQVWRKMGDGSEFPQKSSEPWD